MSDTEQVGRCLLRRISKRVCSKHVKDWINQQSIECNFMIGVVEYNTWNGLDGAEPYVTIGHPVDSDASYPKAAYTLDFPTAEFYWHLSKVSTCM